MPKVVIIDDEYDNLNNLSLVLASAGHEVFKFDNGFDALEQITDIAPDIIICDIMMPKIDGYAIKEKLSEKSNTTAIPFIFLSAKSEAKDIREGLIRGADDYLLKPFDQKELLKTIDLRLAKVKEIQTQVDTNKPANKVCIKLGKELKNINCDEILFIEAENQYSSIYTSHKTYKVARSLTSIEEILPSKNFLRIHRSTIVNLDKVEKFFTDTSNRLKLEIKSYDKMLSVSQRFSKKVREKLTML